MCQALRESGRGRIFTAINVTAMNIGGTVGVLQALACKPNGQGYILCIDIRTITLTEIIFTAFIVTAMNMTGTVGVLRALACNPSGRGNLLSIEIMTSTIWAQQSSPLQCTWEEQLESYGLWRVTGLFKATYCVSRLNPFGQTLLRHLVSSTLRYYFFYVFLYTESYNRLAMGPWGMHRTLHVSRHGGISIVSSYQLEYVVSKAPLLVCNLTTINGRISTAAISTYHESVSFNLPSTS